MLTTDTWTTPAGHPAVMTYRERPNSDWNTISACLRNPMAEGSETGNEYILPSGLSGWGLDLGAHVGSVAIGLLLDNPEMRVVAIEAVPPNVELIRVNLEQNGLSDRCVLLAGAAWEGTGPITIEYGYTGSEVAEAHAFIGSVTPWMDAPGDKISTIVPRYTLKDALAATGGKGFVWAKSDCEGCEHSFFRGPGLRKIGTISGEWHHRDGSPESFAAQLSATHDVTWGEGIGGGPFMATRR